MAVVGGLFFSQFLTLYITPVFYTYMEAFLERFNAWREGRELVPSPSTAQPRASQQPLLPPSPQRAASRHESSYVYCDCVARDSSGCAIIIDAMHIGVEYEKARLIR